MFYATASRGFKGPGFNTVNFVPNTSQPVSPEVADDYEIGTKASWLDRRLSMNLSVFIRPSPICR